MSIEGTNQTFHNTYCFLSAISASFASLCCKLISHESFITQFPEDKRPWVSAGLFFSLMASNYSTWRFFNQALENSTLIHTGLMTTTVALLMSGSTGSVVFDDNLSLIAFSSSVCIVATVAVFVEQWWVKRRASKTEKTK